MMWAMKLSFFIGIFLFWVKAFAAYITDSVAIFSDAAESLVHVFVVGFSLYSLWLSQKPADSNHPYGHEKISFFSAGFEGALIMFASFYILYEAIERISFGREASYLGLGSMLLLFAIATNLILSLYLIRQGKKHHSLILEANGKHILTDCWTSIGALIALGLVNVTGIYAFRPAVAILIAFGILFTGFHLMKKSIGGLMDERDNALHRKIAQALSKITNSLHLDYHHLRERAMGHKILIEFHLLFPTDVQLLKAHEMASQVESELKQALPMPTDILTHLEPMQDHDQTHKKYGLPL